MSMSLETKMNGVSGSTSRRNTPGLRPVLARTAFVVFAGLALSACSSLRESNYTGSVAQTGTEQYPISVERAEVSLSLEVAPGTQRLNSDQRARVSAFVGQYRRSAGGRLSVKAPSGTVNEMAALSAVADIRLILPELGVPRGAVRYTPYGNGSAGDPPVVISYLGYRAVASDCGNWSQDLSVTRDNRLSPNFACAYQYNIAAMVSDPRDFERARPMGPASTERRGVVRDKYIRGEVTAAETNDTNVGTISEIGQ